MDEASHALFHGRGVPTDELFKGKIALPILEAHCEFKRPLEFNMHITIQSTVVFVREKVFKLQHDFLLDDEVIASGYEVRAWVSIANERPKAMSLPTQVMKQLTKLIKGE